MPGFLVIDPYAEWIRGLTPDPADQAWLFEKFRPQPLATYTQPIRLGNPAAAALSRAFIFCTEGKGDVAVDPTCAPRPESGQLQAGPTGNCRIPTWRRSMARKRRPRRSCH